jgi:hypothetical protein
LIYNKRKLNTSERDIEKIIWKIRKTDRGVIIRGRIKREIGV